MVTVRRLLHESSMRLGGRVDAEALLLHVLGQSRAWLFAHAGDALDMDVQTAFQALVARRAAGEPVAYLTGRRGFWTLELEVTPATLIPRPETELLVELALQRLPHDAATPVADLGTGSGAVALAIASERAYATVVATDASPEALAVAGRNAQRLGVANVRFIHGDWLAPLGNERLALIVSNPPYIEASDPHLAQGDLRYEPVSALASGTDGLRDIRHIIAGADAHLESGGWLLLEHGWNQGEAVRALLCAAGFEQVFTAQDLEKRDRVSGGRREG